MDDELAKLRELTGQLQKLTFEAVKAGTMAELPEEEQLFARAMQEHMPPKAYSQCARICGFAGGGSLRSRV